MGAPILNPLLFPRAYDALNLAGKVSPGVAKVSGFDRPFGWDVKEGKGVKGATITLNKFPPAKGSVTLLLWQDAHFDAINDWLALFQYDASKKPATPVDAWHPTLAANGVSSVVCTNIGPLVHEGKNLYSLKVDLLEYWPPPKKDNSSTPKGSKADAGKKGGATPGKTSDPIADAKQRQIADLLAEAKKP